MITVTDLTRRFEATLAVDRVSFQVDAGQTLALVGTSGSGKTTTLRMVNRLIEPTSGAIDIDGEDAMSYSPVELRRRMGYIIQDIGLFPHYTAAENIAVVPRLVGWKADRIRKRTYELLEQLALPPDQYADQYPHQLSGGQQQRVGIARALAADPPIILMDEPFGALDPVTRRNIRREFMELEAMQRKTIILVTHDLEEAFEMADLICLLDAGRTQQLGPPHELLYQPANDFVRQFIAEKAFQLELGAVTVGELFDDLPHHQPADESLIQIKPETTVLRAMARLTRQMGANAAARVEVDGREKVFYLKNLLDTFRQARKASP